MRELLVAIALITLFCSTAIAGPKEEALQVLEKWTKAFTDADVDRSSSSTPQTLFSWAPVARLL